MRTSKRALKSGWSRPRSDTRAETNLLSAPDGSESSIDASVNRATGADRKKIAAQSK